MLGTKDTWAIGTLSQATFCKELMRLYTKDPIRDEYALLRGDSLPWYEGYPLRRDFINGQDAVILEMVWRFFFEVAKLWPDQWNDRESILTKTTGYAALIHVLRAWLLSQKADDLKNEAAISRALSGVKTRYEQRDRRFVRDNFPAGNQGVQKLRDSLLADLGLARL
jgi:hypothetical protein